MPAEKHWDRDSATPSKETRLGQRSKEKHARNKEAKGPSTPKSRRVYAKHEIQGPGTQVLTGSAVIRVHQSGREGRILNRSVVSAIKCALSLARITSAP